MKQDDFEQKFFDFLFILKSLMETTVVHEIQRKNVDIRPPPPS